LLRFACNKWIATQTSFARNDIMCGFVKYEHNCRLIFLWIATPFSMARNDGEKSCRFIEKIKGYFEIVWLLKNSVD
jgi:hypothetical protein